MGNENVRDVLSSRLQYQARKPEVVQTSATGVDSNSPAVRLNEISVAEIMRDFHRPRHVSKCTNTFGEIFAAHKRPPHIAPGMPGVNASWPAR